MLVLLQLLVNGCEVGSRIRGFAHSRFAIWKQLLLDADFIPVRHLVPVNTGSGGRCQILGHCALRDPATAGDLFLFQPQRLQPEHFFNLAHR